MKLPEDCDICGRNLTKRQSKIYDEISDDDTPCHCELVFKIDKLEKEIKKLKKYNKDD